MSIQRDITLRSRGQGLVRFDVPEQLCDQDVAQLLTDKILELEGVYRVKLFSRHGKLSIHYQDSVYDFIQLAHALYDVLAKLDKQGMLTPEAAQASKKRPRKRWSLRSRFNNWKATSWANEKYTDAKETVQAAKILTKIGLKAPKSLIKNPEKAIIDFLNDILVLYLIKLHWSRITQEWIPRPWTHRYEWTAVFYLFYLLLRSRKRK